MIRTYLYKKYNSEDVLVLAHLKHGSRWLEEQQSDSIIDYNVTNKTLKKIAIELRNQLFVKINIIRLCLIMKMHVELRINDYR